ncbi:MAG: response regulator, partial [Cyanobacteria bacterium J06623_1]
LLNRYQDLQTQLPDIIYANMSRLLNGKRTLRDLAVRMDKNVLDVTCGIVPYFFKGYLRLLEIADLADAQALR